MTIVSISEHGQLARGTREPGRQTGRGKPKNEKTWLDIPGHGAKGYESSPGKA